MMRIATLFACVAASASARDWSEHVRAASCAIASLRSTPLTSSPLSCFPLLPAGTHFGVSYSPPSDPAGKNATDAAYAQALAAGVRMVQLSLPWRSVETSPQVYNFQLVQSLLAEIRAVGGVPLFNLGVIDTDNVVAPSDLVDPRNPDRLAGNLTWTSNVVLDRYAQVMSVVAPLVAYYDGFYIGLGNEVDATLQGDVPMADSFVNFAYVMAGYIRNLTSPQMAVGATLTVGGLGSMSSAPPQWLLDLLRVADNTPLTYYPLNGDFTVRSDPALIAQDMHTAISVLPLQACVIFQEFGAPSGYNNASSTDNSSSALQASMYSSMMNVLSSVNGTNPVRGASAYQMVDMDPSVCASFVPYYNVTIPAFLEYLCTLGMFFSNGTAKPAWSTFLAGV